jgi:hypothetical protein
MKYNHAFTFSFSLVNASEDGTGTTAQQAREAIMKRLATIDDAELLECIGLPFDTYEEE